VVELEQESAFIVVGLGRKRLMTEACMQHGFKFWLKSSELFCGFYNLEIGVVVFQISGCIFVSNLTRRRLNFVTTCGSWMSVS
jgi:hypothetical protein